MQVKSFILLTFLVLTSPSISNAEALGNLDDIAKGVATYFPKGYGKVLDINGDMLSIEMEGRHGLSEGVLLSIYRTGDPFYHPVTGVVLGQFEEEVAPAEVIQIDRERVIARRIGSGAARPGDQVRITKARIPVGIKADGLDPDRYLLNEFLLALEDTGRFSVTALSPQSTVEEAAAYGHFYVITLTSLRDQKVEGTPSQKVVARLQNVMTGKVFSEMAMTLTARDDSDLILDSFQRRLFEKHQTGVLE
jgi:hypothetical protein